ncbi:hypothetical protein F5X71_24335 [Nocardia brasiliensis]|uniref:Uncharacterized protein n=1 Tax=Nocardia brasiliensis TaxID=37326 RepID=A0A6G9XVZ8_NOCBR|nr:hypothetical protein [Nocardia brasiliensis]QIS05030.1 hypothetical protein F5X71_24335 [Nocardia brasiliensis]
MIKQVNSKPEASAGGGGTRPGTGQSSMGTMGLLTGVDPVPQQQPGVAALPDVIDIVNQGTPAPGTGRALPSGTDVYTDPRGSSTQWSTPGGQSFSTETTSPRTPPPSSAQQPSVTPQQLTGLEPMPAQQQGPMDLIDVLALTKQGPIKPNTTTELPSGYTIENTTTTTENGVTVSTNTYRYPGADTISRTEYTRTFNEPFNGEGTSYDATVDENGNITSVTVHGSTTIKQILFNPDHSYTVTGIDGTTQRFDPTGKPIKTPPAELDDPRSQATKDWLKEGWHTATSLNRFIQNLQGTHGVDGLKDDAETVGNAATAYGQWALKNKDNPTANAEILARFGQKLFRYDELVEYGPQYWQQKMGLDIGAAVIGGELGGVVGRLSRVGEQAADGINGGVRALEFGEGRGRPPSSTGPGAQLRVPSPPANRPGQLTGPEEAAPNSTPAGTGQPGRAGTGEAMPHRETEPGAGNLEGLTATEQSIAQAAIDLMNSPDFARITEAVANGQESTLNINGYRVQFEPDIPSGFGFRAMTFFEKNGWTFAGDAFESMDELAKTVAQEMYRLNTSTIREGEITEALSELAKRESGDAAAFAEKAYQVILGGLSG